MELFRRGAIKVRNGRIGKGIVRGIVTMGGGHNYPTFSFPAKNFTRIFTLLTSEVLLYFNRLLRLSYNLMKLVRQGDNVGNIPDGRVLAIAEVAILERGYNRRAEFIMSGIRPFETGESDPILEIARETRVVYNYTRRLGNIDQSVNFISRKRGFLNTKIFAKSS